MAEQVTNNSGDNGFESKVGEDTLAGGGNSDASSEGARVREIRNTARGLWRVQALTVGLLLACIAIFAPSALGLAAIANAEGLHRRRH